MVSNIYNCTHYKLYSQNVCFSKEHRQYLSGNYLTTL